MKKSLYALIVPLVLFVVLSNQTLGDSLPGSIFGRWVITKIIPTTNVRGLSPEEAEQMMGKEMLLSPESAIFNGETCQGPRYVVDRISVGDFLYNCRIPLTELGIKDEFVLGVTIYQGDRVWPLSGHLYVKDSNTLVTNQEGAYFEMRRKDNDKH